ncbi:MAG: preprotein translocase subunit SecG [Clostridia bacterium]|nr:preprotein translocase subunit SecG [Clostridia bacterium]
MTALQIIAGIVLILLSVLIILIVLMQEGRESSLGVISGSSDSFMEKGRAKSVNAFLAKWTKWIALVFFVLVLAAMLLSNL